MAPSQGRENVAVFNPIVLALPDWHPDGPDGDVDGYVIPFVMPAPADDLAPNRNAQIAVKQDDDERWRASLHNLQDLVRTADQARALAGAWIRAAEVLDAIHGRAKAKPAPDVEHLDDKPAPIAGRRAGCPACSAGTCTLHSDEVKPQASA